MIRPCIALVLLIAACVSAHPTVLTVAVAEVSRGPNGGEVEVTVTHDVLAYALNDTSARIMDWQMYELLEGPPGVLEAALQDARERFASGFELFADGRPISLEMVRSPTIEAVEQWKLDNPTMRLPLTMEFVLRASLPAGASRLSVRGPYVLDELLLVVKRPGTEDWYAQLGAGEASAEVGVSMVTEPRHVPTDQGPVPAKVGKPPAAIEGRWHSVAKGFRSVLPNGPEYQLFIFGLFLLPAKLRGMAAMVLAFVVAQVSAFMLASLGVVHVPVGIVEVMLAASIVWVAAERVLAREWRGRWPVGVFVFGAFHGLGLATALGLAPVPGQTVAASLAGFAGGTAAACLTILAAAFAVLGWWRDASWYRARIAMPLSIVIGVLALLWLVQRMA